MTFLGFLFFKLKNIISNYRMVLSLRFFVRLMAITAFLYLVNLITGKNLNLHTPYLLVSTTFYLLFFVFLDWYIKVSLKERQSDIALQHLGVVKWISFLLSCVLVCLSVNGIDFFTNSTLPTSVLVINGIMRFWPAIIVPNLNFIIITLLIFYASAILNRNKRLKEENDLTI